MASDKTIHPMALESLFGPAGIAADENGDGYPDRLKVGIRVEPRLSDANLWAQILNLAARLAGEVTALDLPVVKALPRASAGAAALVVHRPSKRHPCEVELRRSARAVHLAGRSAARMAEVLYSLAVHGGRPRGESRPWSSLRVAENEALVLEAFDRRGRGVGRFQLSPARPAAEKKGVERFDLLDLAGALYRVSAENPRAKELALAIELPRLRLSFQAGLALSEAVVRAALEATRVELPLAVSGPGRAGGVVLRVAERPNRGARLSVEKGENASGVIVRAEGDARSLAALLRDWASIGFAAGGPAGEGVRRLRGRIDGLLDMIAAGAPPAARDAPAAVRRRSRCANCARVIWRATGPTDASRCWGGWIIRSRFEDSASNWARSRRP